MNLIIQSMLDDDLYKFTMGACVHQHYPDVTAKYRFFCRTKGADFGDVFKDIKMQVASLAQLEFKPEELEFLDGLGYLPKGYVNDFLPNFVYEPGRRVRTSLDASGQLSLEIDGPWEETILYEVKCLAIINELYFKRLVGGADFADFPDVDAEAERAFGVGMSKLASKMDRLREYPQIKIADFGTRRRFSASWQKYVVARLVEGLGVPQKGGGRMQLVGTSNVSIARQLGITPIGTMAHEFVSGHIALVNNIETAQARAFYTWLQTYKDRLGIALSDTFTTDAFFKDFDGVLARAFSGVRQDSGDPFLFCKHMIGHYRGLGVDPRTKTVVFSDGLDVEMARGLWMRFAGEIGMSFGIGTNLTNDLGFDPLQIVIKMVECNGKPVAKLSDDSGKNTGDGGVVRELQKAYRLTAPLFPTEKEGAPIDEDPRV